MKRNQKTSSKPARRLYSDDGTRHQKYSGDNRKRRTTREWIRDAEDNDLFDEDDWDATEEARR